MSVIVNASTSTGLGITSDNSGTVEIQSNGTTKLTVQSSGVSGAITTATAQATTSGTNIDFTGIPSWAKKITIIFSGVSTSGTNSILIQIGSGSVETSGYLSACSNQAGSVANSTSGFLHIDMVATNVLNGLCTIVLLGSNVWVSNSLLANYTTGSMRYQGGNKTTAGVLDRVRITTVGGTDTFDSGSINIMYEG